MGKLSVLDTGQLCHPCMGQCYMNIQFNETIIKCIQARKDPRTPSPHCTARLKGRAICNSTNPIAKL